MEWIAATDSKPGAGQKVIASYVNRSGNRRTVIARWVAAKAEESDENSDIGEYDEVTDACYDPEGWYECIDNWDDFTAIFINEGEVTHFMPLPAPPGTHINLSKADALAEIDAAVRREIERCARIVETQNTYGDPVGCWLEVLAAKIRTPASQPKT